MERVTAVALETVIFDRIARLSENKKSMQRLVDRANLQNADSSVNSKSEQASLYRRLTELDKEIKNTLNFSSQNEIDDVKSKKSILKHLADLEDDKEKVLLHIENLKKQTQWRDAQTISVDEAQKVFQMFSQNIKKMPDHLQKQAVQSVVRSVVVYQDSVTVEFFGGYQFFKNKSQILEHLINFTDTRSRMTNELLTVMRAGSTEATEGPPLSRSNSRLNSQNRELNFVILSIAKDLP